MQEREFRFDAEQDARETMIFVRGAVVGMVVGVLMSAFAVVFYSVWKTLP